MLAHPALTNFQDVPFGQTTTSNVISSRVISSSPLDGGACLRERTRVVEVPVIEQVTKHVHVRRIVERGSPKITKVNVPQICEVPNVVVVHNDVMVPVRHETVKTVPVKKVIEVERETFQHIPRIETRQVQKEVDVMGRVIEVQRDFLIENRVVIPRFNDVPIPIVVSQTLMPRFVESDEHAIEVCLREYEAEVIPVEIFLPRPVERHLVVAGELEHEHHTVEVPLAQYNGLIKRFNEDPALAKRLAARSLELFNGKDANNHTSKPSRDIVVTDHNGDVIDEVTAGETEDVEDDDSSWIEHMFVPSSTGSVPVLQSVQELVAPTDCDWIDSVKVHDEYFTDE